MKGKAHTDGILKRHVIKRAVYKEWTETKEPSKGAEALTLSIPKSERHYQFSARRSKEKK